MYNKLQYLPVTLNFFTKGISAARLLLEFNENHHDIGTGWQFTFY